MSEGFANQILGGVGTLIRTFIRSKNYVPGTAGWRVTSLGDAEFNNVTVRGIVDILGGGNEVKLQPTGTVSALPEIDLFVNGVDNPGSIFAFKDGSLNGNLQATSPSHIGRKAGGLALVEETSLGSDSRLHVNAHILQLNDPTGNNTFCDIQNNFISQGRGVQFGTGATTSLTTAAQAMALAATPVSFTWKAGRVYKLHIGGRLNTTVTDTLAIFKLLKGTTTAAPVAVDFGGYRCLAGALQPVDIVAYIANATGADIVQQVQLSLQSNNANTVTWDGGGGNPQMPRSFDIEDYSSINEWSSAGYVTL